MSGTTWLVSVSCTDQPGLVAAITARLFDLGGNLGDTTFAVYGAEAEFTALVELPEGLDQGRIEGELAALEQTRGGRIEITPFDRPTTHGPSGQVSHIINVSGGDQPGLIARITEVFVEFGVNIVHLEAISDRGRYATRFSVNVPSGQGDKCLAVVANTAEQMDLECRIESVE